jgi:hypothetical protein
MKLSGGGKETTRDSTFWRLRMADYREDKNTGHGAAHLRNPVEPDEMGFLRARSALPKSGPSLSPGHWTEGRFIGTDQPRTSSATVHRRARRFEAAG